MYILAYPAAARVAGLELGFVPSGDGRDLEGILSGAERGDIKVVYLLGADEIPMERLGKAFVIYQGSHGDAGANRADVILPGAAYTEKSGITPIQKEHCNELCVRCSPRVKRGGTGPFFARCPRFLVRNCRKILLYRFGIACCGQSGFSGDKVASQWNVFGQRTG